MTPSDKIQLDALVTQSGATMSCIGDLAKAMNIMLIRLQSVEQDNKLLRSEMDALAFTQRHMRSAPVGVPPGVTWVPGIYPGATWVPGISPAATPAQIAPYYGTTGDPLPPLPGIT